MTENIDSTSSHNELTKLLLAKIEGLRLRLLDASKRNPLVSAQLKPRSNSLVRIVDELPDVLAFNLTNNNKMKFLPLPALEQDPEDEATPSFLAAISAARLSDPTFIDAMEKVNANDDDSLEQVATLERSLKDQVRDSLGMQPHSSAAEITLVQHAKNNNISHSYDLPLPDKEHEDGRHRDDKIQTLLLPDQLERKMNALLTKGRTWIDESGINVMRAVFGFLEWKDPNSDSAFAPLLLLPVEVQKKTSASGAIFWVSGIEEEIDINEVLTEKLKIDFDIKIPPYDKGSVEDYFKHVEECLAATPNFNVKRQVVFGVFPSSRMAMYADLDTDANSFDKNETVTKILLGSNDDEQSPFADEYMVDDPEVEKKVPLLVLDADSSQYSSLVDVADGKNIALEGPPGTGKSQTIVNAIAAAMGKGKKILFIAEKMAALNVVRSRLEAVGLGAFVLPLQATRSNRSQVIESLRERVEMAENFDEHDYDDMRKKFEDYRKELSEYIEVMSSKFGETGATVHSIIGKNIKTSSVLSPLPREIRDTTLSWAENHSYSQLQDIKKNAADLAEAFCKVRNAGSFWREHGLSLVNKFLIEEISDSTITASQRCRQLGTALSDLSKFNIDPKCNSSQLQELSTNVKKLNSLGDDLDTKLIGKLSNEDASNQINYFLEQLAVFQFEYDKLSNIVTDPDSLDWESKLDRLINLLKPWNFGTIDPRKIERIVQDELDGLKSSIKKAYPFISAFPMAAEVTLAKFQKSKNLISRFERQILAARSEATADENAAGIIEQASILGKKLKHDKTELKAYMSLEHGLRVENPSKFAATINNGSTFSFFSAKYRSAKRTYNKITLRPDFSKHTAFDDLRRLTLYQEEIQKFRSLPDLEKLFSSHFMAEETDFEIFLNLLTFYRLVEEEFPGIENISIRRLLKLGDIELLYSIPDFGTKDIDLTLAEAERRITNLEKNSDKVRNLIEEITPLVEEFLTPQDFSGNTLAPLKKELQELRLKKDDLTSSQNSQEAAAILGAIFKSHETEPKSFEKELKAAKIIISVNIQWGSILLWNVTELNLTALGQALSDVLKIESEIEYLVSKLFAYLVMPEKVLNDGNSWEQVADNLLAAANDVEGLSITADFNRLRTAFENCGGDNLLVILKEFQIPLDDLGAITDALIARAQAKLIYKKHGVVISTFSGERLDKLRHNLADTDRKLLKLSRKKLGKTIYNSAGPPSGNGIGKKSTWTEMALVRNEINKKSRFVPVRDLTQRAGKTLLELKPCWMMSPLAVAQYIPRDTLTFDLCIIDEASQMPPEAAIGALVRSHQALIVGDTNQLPPTSFFKKIIDDEDADEDEMVSDESILEQANAAFRPKRRLRWHYRSRHSSLIKFSNHYIYDNDLIVFPSADENRKGMGVSYVFTEGTYKAGVNAIEANHMIAATLEFMKTNPDRSLGVVTLNQKQRDLLIDQFEFALKDAPWANRYVENWKDRNEGLENFFIKNLENVQGDERDVIFIGTVYGPEKQGGRTMQRFGPINGLSGRRRLNVLFSRAKQQIITFSSMNTDDIVATEHGNKGAYLLKCWLEYSATGRLESGTITNKGTDSDLEDFVIEQIESMGFVAEPQVGVAGYFIDIGVKHPDWPHGFILGVECDGASYHSSKSARDRDRLRQEVLEGLGWVFHRIWSTNWFLDPIKEAERLRNVLNDLLVQKQNYEQPVNISDDKNELLQDEIFFEHEILGKPNDILPLVDDSDVVNIGDKIKVQYLDGENQTKEFTISKIKNSPDEGYIGHLSLIGKAILGCEEGEEITFLIGQHLNRVKILHIEKNRSGDSTN